jgi:tripartite-type tricarboxylate transporter receptor subunit TctC
VSLPAACMFVPKGTPNEIIKKLHDAFKEAIQEKKFKEFIVKVGITTEYRSTEEIQRFAVGERQKVQNVLREIGMIQ